MRNAADWCRILMECHVKPAVAAQWGDVFADVVSPDAFRSDLDLESWLGQILHESQGLTHLSENLNYSAERLMVIWPKRFPNMATASMYAHQPIKLANLVYGGRMGNDEDGDGWLYRGRSPLQITGKANYDKVGALMGQDLVSLPELLEQPRYALEACIAWWEGNIPDDMLGDPERTTKRVNGGLIGLADREELTDLAKSALA
jgi:putative chitinase